MSNKILKPDFYLGSVLEISDEFMKQNGLLALILDVDNTLIDINKYLSQDIVKWAEDLKEKGYKLFIVSNTNNVEKVSTVANKLGVEYINLAKKPFKKGFVKAQKKLNVPNEQIGAVGDQIFTDVIGGNRAKMKTILVDPISPKDYWYTAWKRPLENKLKQKLIKG